MGKKNNERKYLNFPIVLLEGFLDNHKDCLFNAFAYAAYHHAFNVYEVSEIDESNGYYPDDEEVIIIDKTAYDKFDIYRINAALKYFNLSFDKPSKILEIGKPLNDSIAKPTPFVGIECSMFLEFHNENKTQFEKLCLLAFLGLKSIAVHKPITKANFNYLFARMDGKAKTITAKSELSNPIAKYCTRHYQNKIINELRVNWGLSYYAHTRGFYYSFTLDYKHIAIYVETKKTKNKVKELNAKENMIRQQIKAQIAEKFKQ